MTNIIFPDTIACMSRISKILPLLKKIKRKIKWKKILLWCIAIGFFLAIVLGLYVAYLASQLPDPSVLSIRRVNESTKIYDRTGKIVLYDVHGEERRTIIAWEQIPENIKNATLAAEDNDFYNHSGIDIKGIMRAVYRDILSLSASEGGSTITQQLVKKALVGENKTIPRKIKEAILAIKIERAFSKNEIFAMYLNQIPYGSNAYGIEAASQTFFGKHANELTLGESALLAGLPKAPTYYSPYGSNDRALKRRNYILQRMHDDLGMITDEEYDTALAEKPALKKPNDFSEDAPHFVIMVRDYLVNKYGEDMIQNGGLKVITTLDMDKQKLANTLAKKYGDINEKQFRANNLALVSMDPKTGQILALLGSRDYFNTERNGNYNVALTNIRQPGSSFKPFAYATAFSKGFTDSTILFDLPTEFNPSCAPDGSQTYETGPCYYPRNYLGNFSGPVTMRQSLARSLNIPAVKTLYLAGIKDTVDTARRMGLTNLDPKSDHGLSLVLGGTGVSLVNMVSGYSVFANDGMRAPPNYIISIQSSDGSILEQVNTKQERVLNEQVARLVTDVLSDNNARSAVFGFTSKLVIPGRPVAAKTGTTQNNRDGWLIGYTPSLVTGIWTGNNNDTPMTAAGAGLSAAGPMWNDFMTQSLKGTPIEEFIKPDPIDTTKVMLNGSFYGPDGIHSILYYIDPSNPTGEFPSYPNADPQFNNWEFAVRAWAGINYVPNPTPSFTPNEFPTQLPPPVNIF